MYLIKPISILINQSLLTGIFPDQIKTAKIIPLYQKNDDEIMNNYRPISLLPVFSKIFEKVVQNQVYHYLNSNNLLYGSQHGFRETYSTETAVIELIDYLKHQIDKKHIPLSLFLDLSKAFDTINFDIMLLKLRKLGINNISLNWFESYLTNRKQFVSFNGVDSTLLETKTGVPQGSVLGPLLFIIYINDLNRVSNFFKVICFADDSTLIVSLCFSTAHCNYCLNNNSFTSNMINNELEKIFNWFCLNKLSINPDKTKYMLFRNKQKSLADLTLPILKMDNKILKQVNEFLYLGTFLDEHLSWETHINYISNKISKNNGILRRLKFTVPKNILKILYYSLVNPYLNYSILAWGYNLNRIEKLQKQSVRIITHSYYLEHTGNLFKSLKILKVEDIFKLKQILFYKNFITNKLPHPIKDILTIQHSELRACHTSYFLKPPAKTNTEIAKQCIRYSIPDLINDKKNKTFIEKNCQGQLSSETVKNLFKIKTFATYTSDCTDENCYPCKSRFFSSFGFFGTMKFLHIFYYMRNFTFQKIFLSDGILSYINIFNYTKNNH